MSPTLRRLLVLIVCGAVGIWAWDTPVLWPLKMIAVLMHESGHAAATWLFGGSVAEVTLAANESGQCLSRIPVGFLPKIFVYSAGYIGNAVISGLLLVVTYRFGARRSVLAVAALWLGTTALFLAGNAFTVLFCLGTCAAMIAAAKWLPESAVEWLNLFVASFVALYAAVDVKDDLWNSAVRARSDAALLAELTYVPALVWAALWTLLSIAVLLTSAWWSIKHRRTQPLPSAA
jgi:hypothetical protein